MRQGKLFSTMPTGNRYLQRFKYQAVTVGGLDVYVVADYDDGRNDGHGVIEPYASVRQVLDRKGHSVTFDLSAKELEDLDQRAFEVCKGLSDGFIQEARDRDRRTEEAQEHLDMLRLSDDHSSDIDPGTGRE